MRSIDRLEAQPAADSEDAQMPFFSPDSRWLALLKQGKLLKRAVSGGAPVTIIEVDADVRGACWTTGGEIVLNGGIGQGLFQVSAEGAEPRRLTEPNREEREKTHRLPEPRHLVLVQNWFQESSVWFLPANGGDGLPSVAPEGSGWPAFARRGYADTKALE